MKAGEEGKGHSGFQFPLLNWYLFIKRVSVYTISISKAFFFCYLINISEFQPYICTIINKSSMIKLCQLEFRTK